MKKSTFFLLLVILIAGILRLWKLGQIPVSMSDDEVRLTYNAYSIWNTGKDINGLTLPLSFEVAGYSFNPVPIYLLSPLLGLFGLNTFIARLPFAVGGIITIAIVYLIVERLFKDKTIAIFSSLTLSFSAWHLQLSRFAYEGSLALLFYILGIYIFLIGKKDRIKLTLLSMGVFFLAFYSYSGTKLIFLPLVIILVFYKYKELSKRQLVLIVAFVLFTFFSFLFLSKTQNAGQYGSRQFFFQDPAGTSLAVELERRASHAPDFLTRIYHSKFTYWFKIFIDHYSYAFSPQYLFLSQEGSGIFAIWFRGQMYYIEAPLLILGILYAFVKKRKECLLLFSFLVIAPLPSGLGAEPYTYTIRSSFLLPWLQTFVGIGVYSLHVFIKNKNLRNVVYACLFLIYLYLIGGYLTQYYYDWSKYGAKYYSKAAQDLIFLINKNKDKDKIIVDGGNSMTFLHYAFYNKINSSIVQSLYRQKTISIDNVVFGDDCFRMKAKSSRNLIPKNSLYILSRECPGIKPGVKKGKSDYIMDPDLIIKSFDATDEWLVYKSDK